VSEINPDAFDDERPMPPRVRLPASASRWKLRPLPVRQRAVVDAKMGDFEESNEPRY
jgi:hypothetical protein